MRQLIESLLYFTLGFLCAAFLAALVAPAVWRRAVMLTRRRIEASVPLTLDEIRAGKDSQKAEYAMEQRRLEIELKAAKTKLAEQAVLLARARKDVDAISAERASAKEALSRSEGETRDLREESRRREDGLQAVSSALARTEEMLTERKGQLEKLGKQFDEISFIASSRQIDLVARESEIERLNSDLTALRARRLNAQRSSERLPLGAAGEALRSEISRSRDLDIKIQAMSVELIDREERLGRRDRETERLREQVKALHATAPQNADMQLVNLQKENMRLEAKLADLVNPGATGQNADIASHVAFDSDTLREQMQDLAAQVVAMTAKLEGPESPINQALAKPYPHADKNASESVRSLADRVQALRELASPSSGTAT